MNKKQIKPESLTLSVNGVTTQLDYEDKGYYLGAITVEDAKRETDNPGGVSFHVEAIEVTVKNQKQIKNGKYSGVNVVVKAKNSLCQNRVDNWEKNNKQETPKLVVVDGVSYFVNIEAYAA